MLRTTKVCLIVFFLLLTSCRASQPSLLVTMTPTEPPLPAIPPTETLIPLANFSGSLFFDYNGSGLWEDGEPSISDFGVCAKPDQQEWVCTQTDEQGHFIFEGISPEGAHLSFRFEDSNDEYPALAFRYINLWHGPVVIDAYEINGIRVPEQHLNDTEVLPIDEIVKYEVGNEIELGLMQGYLTLPFDSRIPICIISYFDYMGNEFDNRVRDWQGSELLRINTRDCTPGRVYDWHNGIDYAYGETIAEFVDFEVIAGAAGQVYTIGPLTSSGGGSVRIKHFDGRMSDYGHLGEIYVKNGQKVHRGMLMGRIFTNWDEPHLHFELMGLPNEGRLQWNFWRVDIYRDPLDNNSLSFWTKDNDPQYP